MGIVSMINASESMKQPPTKYTKIIRDMITAAGSCIDEIQLAMS